MHNVAILINSL